MRKPNSNLGQPVLVTAGLYEDPPPADLPRDRGLTWVIVGGTFLVATVVLWRELNRIESNGGALRVTWMVVEAYEWGGKWVPCGITLLCGLAFLAFGIYEWLNCRAHEEPPPRP